MADNQRPAWSRDFKHLIVGTLVVVALSTLLLALARTGLMHASETSDVVVTADGTFAGTLAGLLALVYPFFLLDIKRDDRGLRREGLTSLLLLAIPTSALIELLVALTWTFIMGDKATRGTVAAELPTDPVAMAAVFCLLVAGLAWMTSIVLVMVTWIGWITIITVFAFLAAIGALLFGGVVVFDNPPSSASLLGCAALGLIGLGLLAALTVLRPSPDRPQLRGEAPRKSPR